MERAEHGTTFVIPERASHRWRDQQIAIAGFLSQYGPNTRRGHATELRLWAEWCASLGLNILDDVQRATIYMYAKELEEVLGRKKSTVAHKLSVIAGFYEYCADEDLLTGKNPGRRRAPPVPRLRRDRRPMPEEPAPTSASASRPGSRRASAPTACATRRSPAS